MPDDLVFDHATVNESFVVQGEDVTGDLTSVLLSRGPKGETGDPGAVGPAGATGTQGPAGPPGASSDYGLTFIQSVPSDTWIIPHTFSRRPSVTLLDNDGFNIEADVRYPDPTTVVVSWHFPMTGIAVLD